MSDRPKQSYGDRALVDDVAVERAIKGDRAVRLTAGELDAAFRALDGDGLSYHAIAEVLGVSARTVSRWRSGRSRPSFRDRGAA